MIRSLAREVAIRAYVLRLRAATAFARGPEDWLRIARKVTLGPLRIQPMQIDDEILRLLVLLQRKPPRRLLEIGTARGGSLYLFARVAHPRAQLVSIDLPGGRFGGGYPAWKERIYRSFASRRQRIELIRGNSGHPQIVQKTEAILDGPLDLLYIDGDHRYEGVRGDFETYLPLVAPGGLIVFHDIRPGDPRRGGDVPRFWTVVKADFEHQEILAPGGAGFGIGVLWK